MRRSNLFAANQGYVNLVFFLEDFNSEHTSFYIFTMGFTQMALSPKLFILDNLVLNDRTQNNI